MRFATTLGHSKTRSSSEPNYATIRRSSADVLVLALTRCLGRSPKSIKTILKLWDKVGDVFLKSVSEYALQLDVIDRHYAQAKL